MKKYKIIYFIIYLLLLIMIVTKGINIGVKGDYFNEYEESGIIDGFSGYRVYLIYNLIIISIIFIIALIITVIKGNTVKHKNLIFIGIIILLLFVPSFIDYRFGGVAGIHMKYYTNILSIPVKSETIALR